MTEHIESSSGEHGSPLLDWWQALDRKRGERAELRQCHDLYEVMLCKGFYNLTFALEGEAGRNFKPRPENVALCAAVLSHLNVDEPVEEHPRDDFAKRLGAAGTGEKPPMSELRFKRLITCETPQDLFTLIIRATSMLGGRADVIALADALLSWGPHERGQSLRRQWAAAYYRALLSASR